MEIKCSDPPNQEIQHSRKVLGPEIVCVHPVDFRQQVFPVIGQEDLLSEVECQESQSVGEKSGLVSEAQYEQLEQRVLHFRDGPVGHIVESKYAQRMVCGFSIGRNAPS